MPAVSEGRGASPREGEAWTPEALADLMLAQVEERVGKIEDATLTSLHMALADQIVVMLRAGVTSAEIDPILTAVWLRLRDAWERAGDDPEQTHRVESGYVS